ncbi:MAG: hypothetical protein Tsb0010_02820 [Parvularculaceae bacterium]
MSQPLKYLAIGAGALGVGIVGFAAYFTLLFVGAFAPPLPPMPDWRTPYEQALAAGDCRKASRILYVAFANLVDEAGLEGADLFESGRCARDDLDPDFRSEFENALVNGEDIRAPFRPFPDGRSFYDEIRPSLQKLNARAWRDLNRQQPDVSSFSEGGILAAKLFWLRIRCINPYKYADYEERLRLNAWLEGIEDGAEPVLVADQFKRCGDRIASIIRVAINNAVTDAERFAAFALLMRYLETESLALHHLRGQWIIFGLRGDSDYKLGGIPEGQARFEDGLNSILMAVRRGYGPAIEDLAEIVKSLPPESADENALLICWAQMDAREKVRQRNGALTTKLDEVENWSLGVLGPDVWDSC